MATIYYENRKLVVANYLSDERMDEADAILGYESDSDLFSFVQNFVEEEDGFIAYVYGNAYEEMLEEIASCFTTIPAAGGIVENAEGKILFINKRDKWDLPKGKSEDGETDRDTAIREVQEETGLQNLVVEEELEPSFHIYGESDELVLKKTAWFKFKINDTQEGIPQKSEGIREIKWFALNELDYVKDNTYASITDVLSKIM